MLNCPNCRSKNIRLWTASGSTASTYTCNDCGYTATTSADGFSIRKPLPVVYTDTLTLANPELGAIGATPENKRDFKPDYGLSNL